MTEFATTLCSPLNFLLITNADYSRDSKHIQRVGGHHVCLASLEKGETVWKTLTRKQLVSFINNDGQVFVVGEDKHGKAFRANVKLYSRDNETFITTKAGRTAIDNLGKLPPLAKKPKK